MEVINTTGRRKSAIARIYMKDGNGKLIVNNNEFDKYFTTPQLRYTVMQPLIVVKAEDKYDVSANLTGGGVKGQAEALRLALSRALVKVNPELRPELKTLGLLTRDPREVERKKPGQKKARKRFQFSKR